MNEMEQWSGLARAERAKTALIKHGFETVVVKTKEEAADIVMSLLQPGMKLGFGGSFTIKALGIPDKARELGAEILDHNRPGLNSEEKLRILRAQLTCDAFICSANAVTMDGQIMNIDGNGNRVAAMTFGPKKNILVAGANKIVADEAAGWIRIKSYASPMNNKRLSKDNPCVKTGECMDCEGAGRICRAYQVLKRKPSLSDYTVILVAEDLGF